MAHKILITDGIVLSKRGVAETHSGVALLTRDAGLMYARAISGRAEKSKLRYGLEPFSEARYSLVRGRNEWKVVGVERVARDLAFAATEARAAGGRAGRLLIRLLSPEEPLADLFITVAEGFSLLARTSKKKEVENLECMLVLRILWHLGYVANIAPVEQFLAQKLTMGLAKNISAMRPTLIRTINESLKATGL